MPKDEKKITENPLALKSENLPALPTSKREDSEGQRISYINLCRPLSKPVEAQLARPGEYYMSPDEINLTSQFDAITVWYRWTAFQFDGDQFVSRISGGTEILEHPEYLRIKARHRQMGFKHGKELLLYVLKYRKFATLLFGGQTDRAIGQKFNEVSPDEAERIGQMLQKIRAEHKGTKEELWKKLSEAYSAPFHMCGVRFKIVDPPRTFMAKSAEGGRTKVTIYCPKPEFLPVDEWQELYGRVDSSEFEAQIKAFSQPQIPATAENVEPSGDETPR